MKQKKCKVCNSLYTPFSSLQSVCKPQCAFKLLKQHRKAKKDKLTVISGKDNDKLRHDTDKQYQITGISLNPYSIVSGYPTEVIHHWIYKSHSNNLRYYLPNGIPLTNDEHGTIHGKRPEVIKNKIFIKMGVEWAKDLDEKSKIICKLTNEYLKSKNDELKGKEIKTRTIN